jgi:Ca2+-binding EF-hand superfamily protein
MKGELSFRGREKAEELFDYLDEDRDGYISLGELRGRFGNIKMIICILIFTI